jgi:agmatine deiminase
VPSSMARYNSLPMYSTTTAPYNLIHTGGNFMCDGFGTGFSSNLVVDENPNITTAQIDTTMRRFMGIDRYVRFPTLPFDDIHHIDMHMKLLDEETLLVGQYPPWVSDGPQIESNLQYILANYNSIYGTPYKVVRIPMPPDAQGRFPDTGGDYRTYTNAVFVNKTVLVPSYLSSYDTMALRIWREALPGYNIQMINCNSTITALGALHCITKEISARDPLLISHQPLADTYNATTPYQVDARIQHRSGIAMATLHYRTDTSQPYLPVAMTLTNALTNTWTGYIPAQPVGTKVDYYVGATSVSGKSQVRPMPAPAGYWDFKVLGAVGTDAGMANAVLQMRPAFPNPTNGMTCVPIFVPSEVDATLFLQDMLGRRVAVMHAGTMQAGLQTFYVDATALAGGVYTICLQVDGLQQVQKLVVR